jgi:phosphopantothenoylcysteine decarboxylase/phosphopantothenate--cysteine ligase
MGLALASAAWRRGATVTLVSGPSALRDPTGVDVVKVETGAEMAEAVAGRVASADVLVFAAAVSDFRPQEADTSKVKRSRSGDGVDLRLVPTEDIALATVEHRKPGAVALGFALETEDLRSNAQRKLKEKAFHLIAANSAMEEDAGFEVETNRVTVLDGDGGVEELPLLNKEEVAERLLDRLTVFLRDGG